MLDHIIENTLSFLEQMPKSKRKKKGQFFTSKETAQYMAEMFDFSILSDKLNILDPGSGTGILSAALIERIQHEKKVKFVSLTCYEMDPEVLPLLHQNLEYIKDHLDIEFCYKIIEDDYLLSQKDDFDTTFFAQKDSTKYDMIIGNPPYLRVMRDNPAALAMPRVVHGAPNLYFLFASMSMFNLKPGMEMVYIIPRSWTSGAYFKAFREYFLSEGKIQHIHLFVSRDKVFKQEQVLQETIIIKMKKTEVKPSKVLLTSSQSNNDFHQVTELLIPYDSVVSGKDLYVYLPTQREDVEVIQRINQNDTTLPDVGLRMRTGIVVDFRQRDELREEPGEHIIPLFYSQHIRDGRVNHKPSGKEADWIIDEKPGLIQKNKDYVFCKRFTAKEERRRLQCGIYLAEDFPEYEYIGTQNKINYVDNVNGEPMSKETVYGVYGLLNSTLFDMYYRILNGSTQVNSTEVNSIPVPKREVIDEIGKCLIEKADLSTETCDMVLAQFYK